jgi:hypothetical protein
MQMNYTNLYNKQFVFNHNCLNSFYKNHVFTKGSLLRRGVWERRRSYSSLNVGDITQIVDALCMQRIVTSLKTQWIWSCAENSKTSGSNPLNINFVSERMVIKVIEDSGEQVYKLFSKIVEVYELFFWLVKCPNLIFFIKYSCGRIYSPSSYKFVLRTPRHFLIRLLLFQYNCPILNQYIQKLDV